MQVLLDLNFLVLHCIQQNLISLTRICGNELLICWEKHNSSILYFISLIDCKA